MKLFKRLFGRKVQEPEPPPEFHEETPPDWLIEMKGRTIPESGAFSVRARILAEARTGAAEILIFSGESAREPAAKTAKLERPELDRLLVVLGFSFPDDVVDAPGETETGEPVTVTIFRRDPLAARTAGCNLADWADSRRAQPPVVEIARLLAGVKQRAKGEADTGPAHGN